jgi:Spy/CpxP family protein refolding chaperone
MKSESPMGMGMEMGKAKMEMMSKMMGKGSTETSNGPVAQKALPGFPGASQLYHIGSTGFFLDQPTHITLSAEQQSALNQAKDQALLAKSTADQASAQAEQELWALTAADQPDALKIEAKMREIEKVKGDERLAFIRAVGDASKILTDEQRKVLAGLTPATTAMAPMKGM